MEGLSMNGPEMSSTLSSMRLYGSIRIAESWLVDAYSSEAPRGRCSGFTWTLPFSDDFSSVARMSRRIQLCGNLCRLSPHFPATQCLAAQLRNEWLRGPHQELDARL